MIRFLYVEYAYANTTLKLANFFDIPQMYKHQVKWNKSRLPFDNLTTLYLLNFEYVFDESDIQLQEDVNLSQNRLVKGKCDDKVIN